MFTTWGCISPGCRNVVTIDDGGGSRRRSPWCPGAAGDGCVTKLQHRFSMNFRELRHQGSCRFPVTNATQRAMVRIAVRGGRGVVPVGSVWRGVGIDGRDVRDVAAVAVRASARRAVAEPAMPGSRRPSVETRPVSGPSFAGNRAYLTMREASAPRIGEARRTTSDRPTPLVRWRIMNEMPERSSSRAPSATAGGEGRRVDGRSGL